jgi:hypothetical protein
MKDQSVLRISLPAWNHGKKKCSGSQRFCKSQRSSEWRDLFDSAQAFPTPFVPAIPNVRHVHVSAVELSPGARAGAWKLSIQ